MENKYFKLAEDLYKNIYSDLTSLFNLDELSDAEKACLDIYNDFDSSEIGANTRSIRDAWWVGEKIQKKLQKKL